MKIQNMACIAFDWTVCNKGQNCHKNYPITITKHLIVNENDNLVSYEHALLEKISQQGLSFDVPSTIPSVDGDKPYVKLESNGACASLFKYIPGDMPSSSTPETRSSPAVGPTRPPAP